MTNIEKAKALINSFESGDIKIAQDLLADNYIQHNLSYETGMNAFISAVEYLKNATIKTTVNNIRAYEDGDYVFLHSIYNFAGSGEKVAFDIFRFEDGKIVEHWDNLSDVTFVNPSGHTQVDGEVIATDLDKTIINKKFVENFVNDVLHGKNLKNITHYFNGDNYIQHNTQIADGLSGLGIALESLEKSGIKMIYNKTHLILGQGNFVLVVSEGRFNNIPTSYYDLFRIENNKIAEHWDVIEPILEEDKRVNTNGKF